MKKYKTLVLVLAAAVSQFASAQTDTIVSHKVIANARMVSIGATSMLDTYLSQEKFSGTELRYISHTTRTSEGSRWSRVIVHQGYAAFADNHSGNGGEIAAMYDFSYGARYNWSFALGRNTLDLWAGGIGNVALGFVYNTRGSNNPAQARASLQLGPSVAAAYALKLGRKRLVIGYEASAPLFGVMFSPNYGQSYYEIFSRGNYDRNVVPTTFISTPSLRQTVTADFALGRTMLRIGYLGDIQQAHVNNIKWHTYTHAFLIGIVRRFKIMNLRP